ncbi:CrcB family protein [Glaciihabitans sp. dw_435]|uniref:FluC/FEX family fluoride channel n=1 Tax=Glaciihabitans sp. dw_435 TaxID=2720081 RepID=UPI001BD2A5DD|nr:CrcB family protein [Glaciihabitans sp. dw_435]
MGDAPKRFGAVFLGGALGTGARIGLDALIPHTDTTFPWSTLLINIVGSFALGLLVARDFRWPSSWLRAGVRTGIIGGFTTFSAVIASLVTLTDGNEVGLAALYLVLSLLLGFGAATAGVAAGGALGRASVRAMPLETDE